MIKSIHREKIVNVNFKITERDWKIVLRHARKHTGGNASAWIRNMIVLTPDRERKTPVKT